MSSLMEAVGGSSMVQGAHTSAKASTALLWAHSTTRSASLSFAVKFLRDLMSAPRQSRRNFTAKLREAERVVEWAQSNAVLAFAEVWAPWTMLLPPTASIRDDILRSSPMLLYARVARRLDEYATGGGRTRHDLFGAAADTGVRALNPGLALGRLRVAPKDGAYTRDEIVELSC